MLDTDIVNSEQPKTLLPSLQEIAKLPLSERHKLLHPLIQEIADEVNNDPELNLFSEIEGDGLEEDDD
ncbi:MAG: hypothetical protein AB4041_15870 [Microcystaceae cyanobacterium]